MSAVFVQTISLILLESLEMVSMNLVLLVCALHLAGFGSALPLLGGVPAEAEDEHLERVKRQNSARNWTLSEFSECSSTCGGGLRARSVRCLDEDGIIRMDCPLSSKPESFEFCNQVDCNTGALTLDIPPSGTYNFPQLGSDGATSASLMLDNLGNGSYSANLIVLESDRTSTRVQRRVDLVMDTGETVTIIPANDVIIFPTNRDQTALRLNGEDLIDLDGISRVSISNGILFRNNVVSLPDSNMLSDNIDTFIFYDGIRFYWFNTSISSQLGGPGNLYINPTTGSSLYSTSSTFNRQVDEAVRAILATPTSTTLATQTTTMTSPPSSTLPPVTPPGTTSDAPASTTGAVSPFPSTSLPDPFTTGSGMVSTTGSGMVSTTGSGMVSTTGSITGSGMGSTEVTATDDAAATTEAIATMETSQATDPSTTTTNTETTAGPTTATSLSLDTSTMTMMSPSTPPMTIPLSITPTTTEITTPTPTEVSVQTTSLLTQTTAELPSTTNRLATSTEDVILATTEIPKTRGTRKRSRTRKTKTRKIQTKQTKTQTRTIKSVTDTSIDCPRTRSIKTERSRTRVIKTDDGDSRQSTGTSQSKTDSTATRSTLARSRQSKSGRSLTAHSLRSLSHLTITRTRKSRPVTKVDSTASKTRTTGRDHTKLPDKTSGHTRTAVIVQVVPFSVHFPCPCHKAKPRAELKSSHHKKKKKKSRRESNTRSEVKLYFKKKERSQRIGY